MKPWVIFLLVAVTLSKDVKCQDQSYDGFEGSYSAPMRLYRGSRTFAGAPPGSSPRSPPGSPPGSSPRSPPGSSPRSSPGSPPHEMARFFNPFDPVLVNAFEPKKISASMQSMGSTYDHFRKFYENAKKAYQKGK